MAAVTGIGWVGETAHGALWRGISGDHRDLRGLYRSLRARGLLPSLIHFGRFDPESQRVCLAAGLALHDAGRLPGDPEAARTGMLLCGPDGAHAANLAYFRDYVAGGRALGRGNLFIYTLPTSPGAEAAIGFGLGGPLLYIGRTRGGDGAAWGDAAAFVREGLAAAMLFVLARPGEAVCGVASGRPPAAGPPVPPPAAPEGVGNILRAAGARP